MNLKKNVKTVAFMMFAVLCASCQKEKQLPNVTSLEVSELTTNSATVKSLITSDGGAPITARGVCWSTSPNASIETNKTNDSALTGESKSKIGNLTNNLVYYARAYATNSVGTAYGNEISFTTKNIPALGKVLITELTTISCKISVNISGDNILPITKKGVIYNDGKTDFTVVDATTSNTISLILADLYPNTDYTIKGFVTNASGTFYSAVETFSTCQLFPNVGGGDNGAYLKPNIYLYPTEASNLNVTLGFPKGGHVTTSIPEYGTGWNVNVAPNGMIDNKYGYLFYESVQPDVCQTTAAWCIKKSDLKDFFVNNMTEYGFKAQEITDFVDFWIPRLTTFEYYIIYPQDTKILNTSVTINVSKTPDQLLRLFYLITGSQNKPSKTFDEPKIDKSFSRTGFVITEWGVILR